MLRRSLDTSRSNGCKTNFSYRNLRSKQVSPMRFTDNSCCNRSDDEDVSSLNSRCSALRKCAIVKNDLTNTSERSNDSEEPETDPEADCDYYTEFSTFLCDCENTTTRTRSHSQQSQVPLPSCINRERTICLQRGLLGPTDVVKKNRWKAIPPRNTRIRSKVSDIARSQSCTLTTDITSTNTNIESTPAAVSTSSPSMLASASSSTHSAVFARSSVHTLPQVLTQTRARTNQSPLRRSVGHFESVTESIDTHADSETIESDLSHSNSKFTIFSDENKRSFILKNENDPSGTSPVMISPIGSPLVAVNHGPFRHTLVLDIDETLVHCAHEKIDDADLYFEVSIEGKVFPIYCLLRPLLYEFLDSVSSLFHVVAFTASLRDYADQLLDRIDPENRYFRGRYFRESCGENFCKNLLAVQSDLSSICIVDNMAQAYGLQPANGIDISSWYSDRSDTALRELIPFLATLTFFPDVRVPIRQRQMQQLKIACNGGPGNLFYPNSTTYSPLPTARKYQIDTTSSSLIASAREVEADCTKSPREDDIDLLIDEFGSEECVL